MSAQEQIYCDAAVAGPAPRPDQRQDPPATAPTSPPPPTAAQQLLPAAGRRHQLRRRHPQLPLQQPLPPVPPAPAPRGHHEHQPASAPEQPRTGPMSDNVALFHRQKYLYWQTILKIFDIPGAFQPAVPAQLRVRSARQWYRQVLPRDFPRHLRGLPHNLLDTLPQHLRTNSAGYRIIGVVNLCKLMENSSVVTISFRKSIIVPVLFSSIKWIILWMLHWQSSIFYRLWDC